MQFACRVLNQLLFFLCVTFLAGACTSALDKSKNGLGNKANPHPGTIAGIAPQSASGSPIPSLSVTTDGRFAINGSPQFLLGISYYDCTNWHRGDVDFLIKKGFSLFVCHIDDVSGNDTNSAYYSNGTLRPTKRAAVDSFIDYLGRNGAVADLNCTYADVDGSNTVARVTNVQNAIVSCVEAFRTYDNVMFSVVNEHNLGAFARSHADIGSLFDSARTACPSCILYYSSSDTAAEVPGDDGAHLWTTQSGTVVNTTHVQAELSHGINALAPHDNRQSGWDGLIRARYSALRTHLDTIGKRNIPIIMEEPGREGSGGLGNAAAYFVAFENAKLAGVAGIVFHTRAGFNLASAPLMNQLDEVEREVIANLNTVLARIPEADQDRSGSPK